MDTSLHVASFTWPGAPASIAPTLGSVAGAAEEAGYASLSVMDHFFQIDMMGPGAASQPMLDGYTTLGFLAGATHRLRLELLVGGVTYRHPGLLAKVVTTLDVLSQGRAQLGIGAAWYEREHCGLGVAFPPLAERFERLEETVQICLQMWSDDDGPFEGRHYQLAETLNAPRPLSAPRPPIMIGGGGERKTLRLVARYADACNFHVGSPAEAQHKLDVLRGHCDDAGTDFEAISKTLLHMGGGLAPGNGDQFVADMAEFAAVGIDGVYIMPLGDDPLGFVERSAPVVSRLTELGVE